MKIFLPFKVQEIGGTSTFARKFQAGMASHGHQVTFEPCDDYDLLFLIVQCPLKYLLQAKRLGKPIVQRLDGTYYWSVSGWKFPLMNSKAAYIRHLFTDFSIYQSRYSKECANRFLGPKSDRASTIIYNGVDLEIFSPEGPRALKSEQAGQQIFFTASAFRRPDQIMPILATLERYRVKYGNNYKLYIAGNFINRVATLPQEIKDKNIKFIGKVKNTDLPKYLRSADAFLFTHLNPPCPNNVIEALACGTPICGVADGAMTELVKANSSGWLSDSRGGSFWRPRTYQIDQLADNLARITKNRTKLSQGARQTAQQRFSLDKMITSYVNVFERLLK